MIAIFALSWSGFAVAQSANGVAWPTRTRLGFVYAVFGGDKYKAITNKSSAFGAEVGILKGTWRFGNLAAKIRGLYISGKEDFMDGQTAHTDVSYTLYATEPCLGLHINLMPYSPPGVRAYLSGMGIMSYDHIRLNKDVSFTEINNSDTHIGWGYEIGAGLELMWKSEKQRIWSLWGEIQYRQVTTDLVGQSSFKLEGLQMVGGIGW